MTKACPAFLAQSRGFTLIELIVVISIIAILTGGSLTVFTAFRSKKIAIGDAVIVTDTLNKAKRLAVAAEKPSECTAVTLRGYTVTFTATQVLLQASCPGATPPTETHNLPTGVITGSPAAITFMVLTGGATDRTINVCTSNQLYRVTVTSGGSVSEPQEVAGGC